MSMLKDTLATLISDASNFHLFLKGSEDDQIDVGGTVLPSLAGLAKKAFKDFAASLTTVSSSMAALSVGSHTFLIPADTNFEVGQWVTIVNNAQRSMSGVITSINGTALVVDVQSVIGQGTYSSWIISLAGHAGSKGKDGNDGFGVDGKDAYELAMTRGFMGTLDDWLVHLKGMSGKDAYELAVTKGFSGTLDEWLASLKGKDGKDATGGGSGSARRYVSSYPWETGTPDPTPTPTTLTVSLAASPSNMTTAGSTTLTATVVATNTVDRVEFYRGATLIGTDTTTPYTFTDPHTYADNGTVTYKAVVYDNATNTANSQNVNVTINIPVPPPPDTTPPTISLAANNTTFNTSSALQLTATANDNVKVNKVEFLRNGVVFATKTSAPYTAAQTLTDADNGTLVYSARATDSSNNTTDSSNINVTVNITPPTAVTHLTIDQTTTNSVNTAITNASSGTDQTGKRTAAAQAIITAMSPTHALNIYRDGVVIFPVQFNGNMVIYNDGVDIGVGLGDITTGQATQAADINTGTWTFQLTGGTSGQAVISGTVGKVNSGADIILSDSPYQGQQFDAVVNFIFDRSIDGLT